MHAPIEHDCEADFVIIGGGSAGCALAARLSEDPQTKVVLLEAGADRTSPWLHIPIGFGRTRLNPKFDWRYEAEGVTAAGTKPLWPRGKVLGGSSAINGLIYLRGQASDYDHWRQLGNTGWSFEDLLPYFKRSEDRRDRHGPLRGNGGPLSVSDGRFDSPLAERFVAAAQNAGVAFNDDYNGAQQDGVAWAQFTTRNGFRCSAAAGYLRPAMKRPNLQVVTEALVQRIVFNGKRANSVTFRQGDVVKSVRARREIILSAGAIGSPQILQVSGVGPRNVLRRAGVDVLHEAAGVGRNLQDHFHTRVECEINQPISLNDKLNAPFGHLRAGLQYVLQRKGPLAMGASPAFAFVKIGEKSSSPDVQFLCFPYTVAPDGRSLQRKSAFSIAVCALRPESRGTIEIASADPAQQPVIQPNYLDTEDDRQTIIAGIRFARSIMAAAPLGALIKTEINPGQGVTSDDDLLAYARRNGGTSYHPIGTCQMGVDDAAVCDPQLRVRGLDGLRVVDASVMPNIISGNTNAPTMMIAEKAADMIRASL